MKQWKFQMTIGEPSSDLYLRLYPSVLGYHPVRRRRDTENSFEEHQKYPVRSQFCHRWRQIFFSSLFINCRVNMWSERWLDFSNDDEQRDDSMRGVQCTPRLVRLSVLSLFRLISSLGGVIRFPAITAAATFVCYRVGVSDDTEGRTHEAKLARKSHTNKLSTVRVIFPFVFFVCFFYFFIFTILYSTEPEARNSTLGQLEPRSREPVRGITLLCCDCYDYGAPISCISFCQCCFRSIVESHGLFLREPQLTEVAARASRTRGREF